jgi:uncharacterized protein (DUF3820 family)
MKPDQLVRTRIVLVQCSADYESSSVFNEREQKLLRLGLNEAASVGEVANSGTALLQSLRKRGVHAETIIGAHPSPAISALERAARVKMPFGRHRGREIGVIEPSYLRWCLRECSNLSFALRQSIQLVLSAGGRS